MPRRQSLIALALAGLALGACGRSVTVDQPPGDPACEAIVAAMPERVGDQAQRDTTVPGTAAWGDPPITMRCGVERPAAYTPTSKLLDVNGIGWLSEQTDAGSRFTSVATSPMIEVSVPFAQEPASGPLTEIATALTELAQTSSAS